MGWLIPAAIGIAIIALLAWRYVTGKKSAGYLASTEYWVYSKEPKRPDDTALMTRMISGNPHNTERQVITQREGLLFSDVRLHIAVVRRQKNPHAFRPDLFEEAVRPTAEMLRRLSDCTGLVRVRYASQAPLLDTRHLVFMAHAASAVADLNEALVIYDLAQERLFSPAEFDTALGECKEEPCAELHVRAAWRDGGDGSGYVQSLGLRKVGLPDLRTEVLDGDERALGTHLVESMAAAALRDMRQPEKLEVEHLGGRFMAVAGKVEHDMQMIELKRILGS